MYKKKLYKAQSGVNLPETSDVVKRGKFTLPDREGTQLSLGNREMPRVNNNVIKTPNSQQTWYNKPYRKMSSSDNQQTNNRLNINLDNTLEGLKKTGKKGVDWIKKQISNYKNYVADQRAPFAQEYARIEDNLAEAKRLRKELNYINKQNRLEERGRRGDKRAERLQGKLDVKRATSNYDNDTRDADLQNDLDIIEQNTMSRFDKKMGRAQRNRLDTETSGYNRLQDAINKSNYIKKREYNKVMQERELAPIKQDMIDIDSDYDKAKYAQKLDRANNNFINKMNRLKKQRRNFEDKVYDENNNIAPRQGIYGKRINVTPDFKVPDEYYDNLEYDFSIDVDDEDLEEYMNGGNLFKAQGGLNISEDELKKKGWLTESGKQRTPNLVETVGSAWGKDGDIYGFDYTGDKSMIPKDQEIIPVANESNIVSTPYLLNNPEIIKSYGDVDIDDKDVITDNFSNDINDYDPWQLYEPGNLTQHYSEYGPLLYNVSKYLEPTVERKVFHTNPTLRRDSVTPDYTGANESRNVIMNTLRENSRSPQQFIANAVNANMELAKQKNQIANQTLQQNIQLKQQYLDKVNQNRAVLDAKRQQAEQLHLMDEATKEDFGRQAVEVAEKMGKHKGQFLNQEKSDRIKMDTYLNQLSKDYQYKQLPNGLWEIKHVGGNTTYMNDEQLKAHFDKVKSDRDAELKAQSDAKMKNAQATIDAAKGKTEESKKFGGWLKEKPKPKTHRNRLYL